MNRASVRAVLPPPSSVIASWYPKADLLDSFAIPLPANAPRDPRQLARTMLEEQPAVVTMLMTVRDAVMERAGVATSAEISRSTKGKDRIGFFPVVSSAPTEIVVGFDDSHLDFRTSVAVFSESSGDLLVATTAVRCHNRLGRLYILAIRPFHIAIVRAGLRRAVATL